MWGWSGFGGRGGRVEKQIPGGNDRKKGRSKKGKGRSKKGSGRSEIQGSLRCALRAPVEMTGIAGRGVGPGGVGRGAG